MFYCNNFDSTDIPYIINKLLPSSSNDISLLPSFYQMNEPYRIQLFTFRPEDEELYFTMTSLSPDNIIYTVMEKNDVGLRLTPQPHQSDYYEIMVVLDGSIYQTIENQRHIYSTGSCSLLNPNVRHSLEFTTPFQIALLQYSVSFLRSIFDDLSLNFFEIEQKQPTNNLEDFLHSDFDTDEGTRKNYIDFIPLQTDSWIVENVHILLDAMAKVTLSPKIGASHMIKSITFRLLQLLSSSDNYKTTPTQLGTDTEVALYNKITQLMKSTHGRITRSELEQNLNYSGSYLNDIVKKYTGLNIFNYGMSFCLKEAAKLLIETDNNISEIASMLGFTNRTHFYKLFENMYQMTPTKFRKKYKKEYSNK